MEELTLQSSEVQPERGHHTNALFLLPGDDLEVITDNRIRCSAEELVMKGAKVGGAFLCLAVGQKDRRRISDRSEENVRVTPSISVFLVSRWAADATLAGGGGGPRRCDSSGPAGGLVTGPASAPPQRTTHVCQVEDR